jgi:hypothetical protein
VVSIATSLRYIGGDVTLVRRDRGGDRRARALAVIQYRQAVFLVDTPVAVGDLIEQSLPNGVLRRYEVTRVTVRDRGPENVWIEADFKIPSAPDPVIARPIGIPWLHL